MKNIDVPATGVVSGQEIVDGVNAGFESLQKSIAGSLTKSVAGAADVTLTEAECENGVIVLTGAITANINVYVPASTMRAAIRNSTTGTGFNVTVKTSAGTGVELPRGVIKTLRCDGTNVLTADSDVAEQIAASDTKSTPVSADTFSFIDSVTGLLSKFTFANLLTALSSVFLPLSGGTLSGPLKKELGTAIASAATLNLNGRQGGDVLHITGTTTVTAVTLGAGDSVLAIADAALPLTAGSALLIDGVASGSTYTCAANDRILFIGDTGKVRVQVIPYAGISSLVSSVNSRTGAVITVAASTAVTTSGATSHDITGLPSWAKAIDIPIDAVSTNGSSNVQIQLGSGGAVQTSGYSSQAQYVGSTGSLSSASTTGFVISDASATDSRRGWMRLVNLSGNTWVSAHVVGVTGASTGSSTGGGNVTLSGTLDRVRLTTVNGTDQTDGGSFNVICYG